MPSNIKKICSFFKKRKCARKYRLCNVNQLEQDIKSRCNPHFLQNAWKLKWSALRVICTCDQCDSGFCALQVTALIKPNWYVLLYCCACFHPDTILMEAGWTTVPCPATNFSILICKSSASTKRDWCCPQNTSGNKIGKLYRLYKTSLQHRPITILVSHQAVPPTFYNKIAPMYVSRQNCFCITTKSSRALL